MFRSGANPQSDTCPPMPENHISPTPIGRTMSYLGHIWASTDPTFTYVHNGTMQHAVKEMTWDRDAQETTFEPDDSGNALMKVVYWQKSNLYFHSAFIPW